MSPLVLISVEDIIAENFELTGIICNSKRKEAIAGCHSSFCYYETHQEKIASIVASLVKGHFFMDGNKRTALSTYLVLSLANGLKHIDNDDELVRVFVELATSRKPVEEYARILFPG